ncbi:MAG: helix-turn-helix domain-containing protein [Bacteroidota bacterium]
MKKITQRSDCPISYALDFFGDKWTFLIVRDLAFYGKKFYKDFSQGKEGIATNILSDRLKRLEGMGVVEARVYEQKKTQKVYALTEKGKDLLPILVEMTVWSAKHGSELEIVPAFVARAKADREGLLKDLRARLE